MGMRAIALAFVAILLAGRGSSGGSGKTVMLPGELYAQALRKQKPAGVARRFVQRHGLL